MGAGDMGRRVAEGCLDGEGLGPNPPAAGCASLGHAVTSLGTSSVVPAPALSRGDPWGMEVSIPPVESKGEGERRSCRCPSLGGFPNLFTFKKLTQRCQATLRARDIGVLEVVVQMQSVRGTTGTRGRV